jgi:DNA polymerase-3 subunit beta
MKFRVKQQHLNEVLRLVRRAVPHKAVNDILRHVLVQVMPDEVVIASNNLRYSVAGRCPATVEQTGARSVQADKFVRYVGMLEDCELEIVLNGDDLNVIAPQSAGRFSTLPAEEFPSVPTEAEQLIALPAVPFMLAVDKLLISTTDVPETPILGGVHVRLGAGEVYLASTDGFRIGRNRIRGVEAEMRKVTVPADAMRIVTDLSSDGELYCGPRDDWTGIVFSDGSTVIGASLLHGNFPDVDRAFPTDVTSQIVTPRAAIKDAVIKAMIFAKEHDSYVTISVDDQMKVSGRAMNSGGWAVAEADLTGEPITFGINGGFLLDLLRVMESESVRIRVRDPRSPIEFTGVGKGADSDFGHVIVPMRLR